MNSKKLSILVTGGAGFIGSNVVDGFIDAGHDVTVIDDLSTGNKNFINPKADFIKMDICDKKIETIFKKKKFDLVNHHAAQIDVRKSVSEPSYDAKINIMGSLNVLDNAVKYNCKKFIFISSGGVMYGECIEPKNENSLCMPISPYGISKLTIENYVKFYSRTYGLNYTIFRYGNVYGPRQNPKGEAGVVAIFSDRMLSNDNVLIFGTGNQKRDYVYVKDIVMFNVAALDRGNGETINVGTGIPTSVNQLVDYMSKIYGYKKKPVYEQARAGELESSLLDITKLKNIFGTLPKYDMQKGLSEVANYYKLVNKK
jgi:UDP-glucose 4-epimerase